MILRGCGECLVCNVKFVMRTGVGLEQVCTHTFDCPNCFSPITVQLRLGPPPSAWYDFKENCRKADEDTKDITIVNLHPAAAFEIDQYHSPLAFSSHQYLKLVAPFMRVPAGTMHLDAAQSFELPETKVLWSIVRSVMSLHFMGDPAAVKTKQIGRYVEERKRFLPDFTCSTTFKCVASFFDDAMFPAIGDLRQPLRRLISDLRNSHGQKLTDFENYYRAELEVVHMGRYLQLFDDYFSNFDQFRQLLAYARVGKQDVDELIVGTKHFNEIKLYYGQAYETLTSSYVTLACLNNIANGRTYDTFSSMTLTKYIKDVEKAKKSAPFNANGVLSAFTKWDDSALRNGSHHVSIVRDGESVKYRSGGTGAERDMPFSRYVHMCNSITIACAALMLVELQELSSLSP